jgi:secondary thiamine-phosphate synthase enzyme
MKSYRKELWFETPTRRAFINITQDVEKCIRESAVKDGLALINAMHITASVFINDDESGLHHDFGVWLEKLAPHEPVSYYRHNNGEDNADAHLKRQIMAGKSWSLLRMEIWTSVLGSRSFTVSSTVDGRNGS